MNLKKVDRKATAPRESKIRKWQTANRELIVAMVDNPGLVKVAEAAADFLRK